MNTNEQNMAEKLINITAAVREVDRYLLGKLCSMEEELESAGMSQEERSIFYQKVKEFRIQRDKLNSACNNLDNFSLELARLIGTIPRLLHVEGGDE